MIYMGYKIERTDSKIWGVFCEEHGVDHITRKPYVRWKLTYTARTLEEAKQGCRGHFGRL